MATQLRKVLFLCTGNSARSILAEALLNHWGRGEFQAFSAGSFPKPAPHPVALEVITHLGLPTAGLRSKSWNEFAVPTAPRMDFIFTVCDQAAGEVCPIWAGHPATAHWGLPDPAAITGSHELQLAAFRETARALQLRIQFFLSLRFDALPRDELLRKLTEAGAQG